MRARPTLLLLALGALMACEGQQPSPPPSSGQAPASEPGTTAPTAAGPPAATAEEAAQSQPANSLANASITLRGEHRGDEAGCSLAIPGDVNGDGIDDLLVGAWAHGGTGKAYLLLGRSEGWEDLGELSAADATFVGEAENDLAGFSVCGAGDVNGDGLADFLISAQGNDAVRSNAGRVYLFLGRADADWGQDLSLAAADVVINGREQNDFAGYAVAGLGDIDGDGLDDFAFSRQSNLSDGNSSGIVDIHFGAATAEELETVDTELSCSVSGAMFGHSIAGIGDFNGDGLDDFAIGTPEMQLGDVEGVGVADLVLGSERPNWPNRRDISSTRAAVFSGLGERALTGKMVAAAGDVNGDELADFIIGAPRNRERENVGTWMGGAGQTYLVFGSADLSGEIALNESTPSFQGVGEEDQSGVPIAPAGDINGDGYSDFLVGAPMRSAGLPNNGEVYLIWGSTLGWRPDRLLDEAAARTWIGANRGDKAASALAGGGDLNGDGVDDLAIGLSDADPRGASSGQIHILLGGQL